MNLRDSQEDVSFDEFKQFNKILNEDIGRDKKPPLGSRPEKDFIKRNKMKAFKSPRVQG